MRAIEHYSSCRAKLVIRAANNNSNQTLACGVTHPMEMLFSADASTEANILMWNYRMLGLLDTNPQMLQCVLSVPHMFKSKLVGIKTWGEGPWGSAAPGLMCQWG